MPFGGLRARESGRHSGGDVTGRGFRIVVCGALLFALLSVLIAPQSAEAAGDSWVETDLLNLRAEPGTWAAVINQMPQGSPIEVLDGPTGDGWYQVSYYGNVGWAYGGYLTINGSPGWGEWVGGGGTPAPERWIDIDRGDSTVTLYEGDSAIATYYASLGWDETDYGFYATAIGTYYVYGKAKELTWTEWGQAYITDWVAFDSERLNGFHSYSKDGSGNIVPGGDGATGGCVALGPGAAEHLFDFADYGTRVEVHW
ncbi:MAG: SH3 domain-containing protein [Thermomicrobiales bacterium]